VLMRDNVELFPRLCEQLAEWGVDEISFNALGGNDRPEFHRVQRLQPEHLFWLQGELPKLRRGLALSGARLTGAPPYLQRLHASAAGERLTVGDCKPGERFLFVNEHGRASPCSFTSSDYGVSIEELHSIDSLVALPERFRGMRRTR